MEWRKPSNKRFTELCIYVDANIEKIKEPGANPEIENKIYNYLWLVVKALAIKKCMFKKFEDYDPYAFYSANRLFFALRKNLQNQGKIIKGKEIRPIKSCLNYMKALLNPMRIEYQRETYREVIDEAFVSKRFDAVAVQRQMEEGVRQSHGCTRAFEDAMAEAFQDIGGILDRVIERSPFKAGTAECKSLRITVLLNCLSALRQGKKLAFDQSQLILWRLPKSMASYVRMLLNEFCVDIKREIIDCYEATSMDDDTAEQVLNYKEGQDYLYDGND